METDKEAILKAEEFLKQEVAKYKFGEPFGLNNLPFVLYEAVAKAMDTYAASLLKERDELKRDKLYWQLEAQAKHKQITQLQKENEELRKENNLLEEREVLWKNKHDLLNDEIERLKGLIEIAHARGWNDAIAKKVTWSDTSLNKFKTENNL